MTSQSPRLGYMLVLLLGLCGCMDLTGRGPAPLEKSVQTAPHLYTRQGHIYCMRGWLGIFSTGMDDLAAMLDTQLSAASVSVADEEWKKLAEFILREQPLGHLPGPLVLVGHSYGADDSIRVARMLDEKHIRVDMLIVLDPVTPPLIPANVNRCINLYKSHPATDTLPVLRGVPVEAENPHHTLLSNVDLRFEDVGFETDAIDHFNIEKNPGVHQLVQGLCRYVCPLRDETAAPREEAIYQSHPQPATLPSSTPKLEH